MTQAKKGKSPYVKYNKAPTLYSPEYQRWLEAAKKNNDREMREAHQAWRKRFPSPVQPKPKGETNG